MNDEQAPDPLTLAAMADLLANLRPKLIARRALIVRDRHAYAVRRAAFLRRMSELGHPKAAGWARQWDRVAAEIAPGTKGQRLRYREQITRAR